MKTENCIKKEVNYYYDNGYFVIENYDIAKPFASFLPGIAGINGIPMWTYYCNRGQGISSFGTKDKDSAILEFSPAVSAYQNINVKGFRTFIKWDGTFFEAFDLKNSDCERKILINKYSFIITEKNEKAGYSLKITYYNLPNYDIAGLIRRVELTNTSGKPINFEIADGLPEILPYGVKNNEYKMIGNLLKSWMEVYNTENNIPYYRQRASTNDSAEVTRIEAGNFYLSALSDGKPVKPVICSDLLFAYDNSHSYPVNFINQPVNEILKVKQVTANKIPCGFTLFEKNLENGESLKFNTIIGKANKVDIVNAKKNVFTKKFLDEKLEENSTLIESFTKDIATKTAFPLFDEYAENCYLDNLLRGGYPILLDNKKDGFVYYLYSRKHGDLERDYNWFSLSDEYYSQGNGNYRDVNQNRRSDILFNPFVGDYNIKLFMNLIQADGYNPLLVKGAVFNLDKNADAKGIAENLLNSHFNEFENILKNTFTPGKIINFLHFNNVSAKIPYDEILTEILNYSNQEIEAEFGEGYWIDHFTYNYDLIENYLSIFPDKIEQLLFEDNNYKYFNGHVYVLPRSEKYILNKDGKPRQYGALDHKMIEKAILKAKKEGKGNWLTDKNNKIYTTNLVSKLFNLVLIKFASLDPDGIGIEMDGDKCGWNDAMNGVPGLFGSGIGESMETLRIINFLLSSIQQCSTKTIKLFAEQALLFDKIICELNSTAQGFAYWDNVAAYKEEYRLNIKENISGEEKVYSCENIVTALKKFKAKMEEGLEKIKNICGGIYPTYLIYDVTDYEEVLENNAPAISHYGFSKIKVKSFKMRPLPVFLEAVARSYKVFGKEESQNQYALVRKTDAYDKKLSMYRTSVDLSNETFEIGRIIQFIPGWLEREANFLHMTYKYLYGLISAGLYDDFFKEIKNNFVCFMDPKTYGRNILENSSFIATSCNPDESIHGQGFYARLTGANCEFLSMWAAMMYGKTPFEYINNQLQLTFRPILSAEFFDDNNEVSFNFLSKTKVTYINPHRLNTFDDKCKVSKIELEKNGIKETVLGGTIKGETAENIRNRLYDKINIYLISAEN